MLHPQAHLDHPHERRHPVTDGQFLVLMIFLGAILGVLAGGL